MSEALSSVDQSIGLRIREGRMTLGLSQHQFSELIGVTYQQVHKYEHGLNRVSAGRLYVIACELGEPVEYFFEGLEQSEGQLPHQRHRLLDIMRNVGAIKSEERLEAISHLLRALAGHCIPSPRHPLRN